MPTVSITWHAHNDARTCPICRAIDGYTWIFKDAVPDSLMHPTYGEVWNTQMGSLAHEHQLHKGSKYGLLSNCRCNVEPKFDLKDVLDKTQNLLKEIENAAGAQP